METCVYTKDLSRRYTYVNDHYCRVFGLAREAILGRRAEELFPAGNTETVRQHDRQVLEEGHTVVGEEAHAIAPDGRKLHFWSIKQPLFDAQGCIVGLSGVSTDITARKEAELTLLTHESLLRAIVNNTPVEYWARDLEGRCIMENALVVEHWGSLMGKRLEDTSARPEEVAHWRANNQRAYAGEVVDEEIQYRVGAELRTFQNVVAPVRMDGRIVGIVGFNQDITERKAAADQIRLLAFYDALTRLPNRRLMFDRLGQALVNSQHQRRAGALLLIDLDHFKELNDTQGHDAGDRLLLEVAARLTTGLRPGDTAARLGGDEFVVILEALDEQVDATQQAEAFAQGLQARLNAPCLLQLPAQHRLLSHHFTSSIGISIFHGTEVSAEELLRRADTAMYQAKAAGRNTLRFYDPQLQAQMEARAELAADLRRAMDDDQFLLYYQPQVDARGRIVGAEALLRWQHPVRGMVSPAEFIPLAEETGLIVPLGHQVLESACRQLAAWARHPTTARLSLAVNVSAHQFRQPAFVAQLRELLNHFDAPPARLKLELTESLLLDNTDDTITRMQSLKQLGVGFSLDDFGTGYSSLAYLKRLPLDQLKIDQSFVRDVLTDANDAAIARTIVALGNTLGLAVIAEGVETEAQHRFLADNGCHAYQGYLFSRPLPLAGFEALLEPRHDSPAGSQPAPCWIGSIGAVAG